ncbi:MAG TPA: ROK family protein [Anaerolineae bacterium]|nr:ROK family protein [Anaerolineae bacterium]
MNETYIAIDLGGTRIRAARCRPDGMIEARAEQFTHGEKGLTAVLDRIILTARQVWPDSPPAAIGLGAPGPCDPYTGVILNAPNIPSFVGLPLRDRLREALGAPVYVGNDANVAALAEWRYGAARGYSNVIYLTISTGIGGGVIIDNRLLLGVNGLAGELGHMSIDYRGRLDKCGNVGCLEVLASGPSIRLRAIERLASGEPSALRQLVDGNLADVSVELLHVAVQAGDAFARSVIHAAAEAIGFGVVSLLHIFNPSIVVIGGGVTNLGDYLFLPIQATVERHVMDRRFIVPIVQAELKENVGLLGALALALDPPAQRAG